MCFLPLVPLFGCLHPTHFSSILISNFMKRCAASSNQYYGSQKSIERSIFFNVHNFKTERDTSEKHEIKSLDLREIYHFNLSFLVVSRFVSKLPRGGGAFDSAKNHKPQRRKRQSVTPKREKSQTPKFV